jgi:serine O-acetyltransferase
VASGPLSISETKARIRADRQRLAALVHPEAADAAHSLVIHPSFVCAVLHRISHHLYRGGHRHLARLFWHLNTLVTGADISANSDLGEGLVIVNPAGTSICAHAGRNLTVMPLSGLGSEIGRREDVGAGPGLPLLGDDVVLEPHAGVLGPVRVGHRVRVGAGVMVLRDVPDDTHVEAPAARFLRRKDLP